LAKRSAVKPRKADPSGINPRQPCPCGSGKRYKACHGASGGPVDLPVSRPFEGIAGECELVALREFVPSGTAALTLAEPAGREVSLATVLPMAAAAVVRADGVALVGLQVQIRSSDVSRDLARAIDWALAAEPGDVLTVVSQDGESRRLQDVLAADAAIEPELHPDFSWWMPPDTEPAGEVALSLERANNAILPTERVGPAAYWVDTGEKAHLRWVRPEPEERLIAALARLSARGELGLGDGTRFAGSFRAHGLLVPVWDLDRELHAREWIQPAADLGERLESALRSVDSDPLSGEERRARDGLIGRQVTIR
jgi:hypothetical protein